MTPRRFLASLCATLLTTTALKADVPQVTTDILPVHSLVARVMGDLGEPALLVPPGASPHGYALKPSQAQALQDAALVIIVGEVLTPWLENPIENLASEAKVVELLEVDGTTRLEFRNDVSFEKHSHEHEGEEYEDHEDQGRDDHDHDGLDPHAWLDPENAVVWLEVIAKHLAEADPENGKTYHANANAGKAEIESIAVEIAATLAPVQDKPFIVFHDAYQYFENRFGLSSAGSISLGDATTPSPARLAEIRDRVTDLSVTCALSEPQFDDRLIQTVFEGADAGTAVLDPLGTAQKAGPDLYPALLRTMARAMADCL